MVAMWSMLFCDACGNLLPRINGPEGTLVACDDCGNNTKGMLPFAHPELDGITHVQSDTSARVTVSRSKPSTFPSVLREKHSAVQTAHADNLNTEAVIQKECPRCRRQEMFYHTKQLRSADEGSTVFYRCECGYQ